MTDVIEINRLRWKCRRGMKELDVVLLYYLDKYFEKTETYVQDVFLKLLDMQDPELYFLVLGKTISDDKEIASIVSILQKIPRS